MQLEFGSYPLKPDINISKTWLCSISDDKESIEKLTAARNSWPGWAKRRGIWLISSLPLSLFSSFQFLPLLSLVFTSTFTFYNFNFHFYIQWIGQVEQREAENYWYLHFHFQFLLFSLPLSLFSLFSTFTFTSNELVRLSKETREMIDIGKTPVKSVSRNMVEGAGRCEGTTNNQSQDKEKKRLARKKERRATLILGLIMGSFIACWFPFFFMYSISPVCPVCEVNPESPCCIKGWGFSFAFWLGYSNSALNPVIYTVFNNDFRRAFKKILFKWMKNPELLAESWTNLKSQVLSGNKTSWSETSLICWIQQVWYHSMSRL